MIYIVAQQREDKKGFDVMRMFTGEYLISFKPTDCRTFKTFDEANRAAEFYAGQQGQQFINMR